MKCRSCDTDPREHVPLLSLCRIAADLEEHSGRTLQDPEAFLGNPVNAFKLLKRFTVDWEAIESTYLKPPPNSESLGHRGREQGAALEHCTHYLKTRLKNPHCFYLLSSI